MLADEYCLNCDEIAFGLEHVRGQPLQFDTDAVRYSGNGNHYFDVECPLCGQQQALIIQENGHENLFTLLQCSWDTEPCERENCSLCWEEDDDE